jgi:hypothetical protein
LCVAWHCGHCKDFRIHPLRDFSFSFRVRLHVGVWCRGAARCFRSPAC